MPKYKRLLKHARKPNKETRSFTKNNEKVVYQYGDGSYRTQSHLSGRYQRYNKKGKPVK